MLYQTELSVHYRTPGRTRTPINGSVDHRPIRWTTGVYLDFSAKVATVLKTVKSLQDLQGSNNFFFDYLSITFRKNRSKTE